MWIIWKEEFRKIAARKLFVSVQKFLPCAGTVRFGISFSGLVDKVYRTHVYGGYWTDGDNECHSFYGFHAGVSSYEHRFCLFGKADCYTSRDSVCSRGSRDFVRVFQV